MQGGTGMGWVESKKSKLISAPSRGAKLKSRPVPPLSPLWGGETPPGAKRGEAN